MDKVLLTLHNVLRWVILILLVLSIIKSFSGWKSKKAFSNGDKKIWLFTLISAHITLLIGLYQLCVGRYGIFTTTLPEGTKLMKDAFYRFFWIEHPFGMVVSVILITLGYGMAKKPVSDETKFKKAFWFFFVALFIILATVPWPFRHIIGRPWFPGI
ncbi:MAG TPA: hypothetical protein VMT76_14085 [Puia sp.]|nr:hypothetical protein [Puia sp.]